MNKVDKLVTSCLIAGFFGGIFCIMLPLAITHGGPFFVIEIIAAFISLYIGYRLNPIYEEIKNGISKNA